MSRNSPLQHRISAPTVSAPESYSGTLTHNTHIGFRGTRTQTNASRSGIKTLGVRRSRNYSTKTQKDAQMLYCIAYMRIKQGVVKQGKYVVRIIK